MSGERYCDVCGGVCVAAVPRDQVGSVAVALAELRRFHEREPLVQKLLETLAAGELYDPEGGGDFCPEDVTRDARAVREFKIGG